MIALFSILTALSFIVAVWCNLRALIDKARGYWLAAIPCAALCAFSVYMLAVHIHHFPSTQTQINAGCRPHGGVKEVVAPGDTGAYAICKDGILIRTIKGKYWK